MIRLIGQSHLGRRCTPQNLKKIDPENYKKNILGDRFDNFPK